MTSAPNSRRRALTAGIASSLWLAACGGGGGGGNGSSNLRVLNLTTDLPTFDFYTGDSKQFSALATNTVSSSISLEANTYTLAIKNVGETTALFSNPYSLSKDNSYVAVVWGSKSALQISNLGESEDTSGLDSLTTRVRFLNATLESGALDIYITDEDATLDAARVVRSGLAATALTGYTSLTAKTQRIRITGSGNIDDVRFDVSGVVLAAKTAYTLVITPSGTGGVLLDATLITQGGTATKYQNTQARIRVAASVQGGGVVAVRTGTTILQTAVVSPRIGLTSGSYRKVSAGALPIAVQVNGVTLTTPTSLALSAGTDYTLLVYGPASSPLFTLLVDDNRVPQVAVRAKVRLVNGLSGTALLSAVVSGSSNSNTTDVPSGAASPYINVQASGSTAVDVYSSEDFRSLFNKTAASNTNLLAAQGVYTLFMLDGATSPTGFWVTDR